MDHIKLSYTSYNILMLCNCHPGGGCSPYTGILERVRSRKFSLTEGSTFDILPYKRVGTTVEHSPLISGHFLVSFSQICLTKG